MVVLVRDCHSLGTNYSHLEQVQQTDTIFMDFAKSFDKVSHRLLNHMLHHCCTRGEVISWTKNWLAERKQAFVVYLEGKRSEPVDKEYGVPQGSVLV